MHMGIWACMPILFVRALSSLPARPNSHLISFYLDNQTAYKAKARESAIQS